jgi:hypothetical protein
VFAADANYSSQILNASKQTGSKGYVLVKTRTGPESGCVVDSGKAVLQPGDSAPLVVTKKKECDQAGVGYSFYTVEDKDRKNLLGYVSHRFRDGEFSLQISMFCHEGTCIFRDLSPRQHED